LAISTALVAGLLSLGACGQLPECRAVTGAGLGAAFGTRGR